METRTTKTRSMETRSMEKQPVETDGDQRRVKISATPGKKIIVMSHRNGKKLPL